MKPDYYPRITFLVLILSLFFSPIFGQNGSDIQYISPKELDSTFLNRRVQFDFYNHYFSGAKPDTVFIELNNQKMGFIERRRDNGYNNWFYQQYLESVDSFGKFKLRLMFSEVIRLT